MYLQPDSSYEAGFTALASFLQEVQNLNPSARTLFVRNPTTKVFEAACILAPGMDTILKHSFENVMALDMGFSMSKDGYGAAAMVTTAVRMTTRVREEGAQARRAE
jgi:hypothetical protein